MESLSEVSEYLNNLESMLNDDEVNSVEQMEELIKQENMELETKAMEEDDFMHHDPERPKIHGYKFGMDLVMDEYEGNTEPSVVFGRDFLLATKCTINFGLGGMQINIGELQDEKDAYWLLEQMLKECREKGVSTCYEALLLPTPLPEYPTRDFTMSTSSL
ncbi:hypothetical protein Tco_0534612 [Tanacetum coccineum]